MSLEKALAKVGYPRTTSFAVSTKPVDHDRHHGAILSNNVLPIGSMYAIYGYIW